MAGVEGLTSATGFERWTDAEGTCGGAVGVVIMGLELSF